MMWCVMRWCVVGCGVWCDVVYGVVKWRDVVCGVRWCVV